MKSPPCGAVQNFRVTEIRDRYMKLYPDTQNKNDVRRWVHSFMRTFIKHGLLIDVTENSDKAAHYRATVQLRAINNPQTDKKMDDEGEDSDVNVDDI